MQIIGFMRDIPSHCQHAWQQVNNATQATKDWAIGYWNARRDSFLQSSYGASLHRLYIEPLDKKDYLLVSGGVTVASIVSAVALSSFGLAILPLAVGFDSICIMGSWSVSRMRARRYFTEIACEHICQIRRAATDITYKNQQFTDITEHQNFLKKPEFEHLKEQLSGLDPQVDNFRRVALSPYYEDKQTIAIAHLNTVKDLVQADPQDTAVMDGLKAELDKVGKNDQDLGALETQKQKLHGLKTPAAQTHIDELINQVNDLVRTAQGPQFADAKQSFLTYLQQLLDNLRYKETLPIDEEESEIDEISENDDIEETHSQDVDDQEEDPKVEKKDHIEIEIEDEEKAEEQSDT